MSAGKGSGTRQRVDWARYRRNNENIRWPNREKRKKERRKK